MNDVKSQQRHANHPDRFLRRFLTICCLCGVAGSLVGYSENGFWGAILGGVCGLAAWPTFTDDIAPYLAEWPTLTRRQVARRIARFAAECVAVAAGITVIAPACFLAFGDAYTQPASILGTAWMIWIVWLGRRSEKPPPGDKRHFRTNSPQSPSEDLS